MTANSWYMITAMAGFGLSIWAKASLPPGTEDFPIRPKVRTRRGPYRFMNHPMYLGTIILMVGLGGLGGGAWNALAFGALTELITREWAWRERGRGNSDPNR